jgi:serine/threonine protein phosphatase 1
MGSEPADGSARSKATVDGGQVTDAELSSSVGPLHQRINTDNWKDVYLVGDVHGCINELETLLAKLNPSKSDLVVFVGDLVRKGPDSRAVVERVRTSQNLLSVRGNNEQKLIDGEKQILELTPHQSYLASLPAIISFDQVLVTHGGVNPRRPLVDHELSDFLETRSIPAENGYDGPFWFEMHDTRPRVVFGHTPLDAPVVTDSAIGLDTGCVYGGELTAYDYHNDRVVAVPAEQTYQSRPDRKVLKLPAIQP